MSDETITIEVGERVFILSKLQRHLLYTLQENRSPSHRLYTPEQIIDGYDALQRDGLVSITTQGEELTELGARVTDAIRARPRAS